MMTKSLEERIRERAYELWEQGGQQDGYADEHWRLASLEVLESLPEHGSAPLPPSVEETATAPKIKTGAKSGSTAKAAAETNGKLSKPAPSKDSSKATSPKSASTKKVAASKSPTKSASSKSGKATES
jgi:hypothetical protein